MRTPLFASIVAGLALAIPALAEIPEGDVYVTSDGTTISTGLIAEDESFTVPGVRVFFGELGLDIPNVGEDPGIKALPGTFASGLIVGLEITAALRKWNGVDFSTIPAETMTLDLGPIGPITTPAFDSTVTGFQIPADGSGEWHHHPFFTLNGPASDGVYRIQLEIAADGGARSDFFWLLWNQNADDATAQAAYDNAVATIPAPASLAVAGLLLARRRRR